MNFGWAGAALALALLVAACNRGGAPQQDLPVYNPIADFSLTNQSGWAVSLADLRGRAWVADIIFTRCAGPCLRMSRQMQQLQSALPPGSGARLVSLTTDPEYDTPSVLRVYGQRFGADTNRWMFLTGTKEQIHDLATGSLKLSALPKQPGEASGLNDLFVHSTIFVAVDKQGRLRGVFETGGEGVDWPVQRTKILAALDQLEREP